MHILYGIIAVDEIFFAVANQILHIYIFKDHVVLFLTAPAMTMNGALGGSNIGTHQQYLELSVMVHWRVKYWKERTRNIQYRLKYSSNIHVKYSHFPSFSFCQKIKEGIVYGLLGTRTARIRKSF